MSSTIHAATQLTPLGVPVSLTKPRRTVIVLYRVLSGGGREIVDALFEPTTVEGLNALCARREPGSLLLWIDATDLWDARTAAVEILAEHTFVDDAFNAAVHATI
ncbi:hypothetical protein [Kitasatospora sp. NPDC088548]|uniref:hypothetical protein n=1 Tax=Kitasatospora sp. NPDC088548 TaxID=3364075 RepID=UPI0037FA235B